MRKRIEWIDGLRGLLCIWIVLYHYTYRYTTLIGGEGFVFQFSNGGRIGVLCFFMISGFFCCSTLGKFYEQGLGKWIFNKWERLFPEYFIACIFIYMFYLLSCIENDRFNTSFIDFIRSLFMLPYISPLIDKAHWYVIRLVQFYLLFSIVFYFKLQDYKAFWIFIVGFIIVNAILKRSSDYKEVGLFFSEWIDSNIIEGMLLFKIQGNRNKFYYIIYGLLGFLIFFSIQSLYVPLLLIVFPILLYTDKFVMIKACLSNKVLLFIGSVSYIWYLIHQNIGYIFLIYLNKRYNNTCYWQATPYVTTLATFLIAVTVFYLTRYSQILIRKRFCD